ncbi:autotransporter outer membrane beta-barrel domain-containing protein [Rickettsia endosymbiont of Orchestes rusci]|uniref:autotransporter outer membrane beta-barrel domain-containing protein n=1 Tax=Rickettsia endosymbiont of Orchestes rusci TaxID=3066250 RepID=UPI00313A95D9
MAQKPSFLKRITTASTVAFAAAAIVGTGSTAFAQASRTTIAAPATTLDGTGFDQTAAPADLPVQSAAGAVPGAVITATFNGAINFNTPNGDFNGILLNTANNLAVTITNNTQLGFISNLGNAANAFNFTPAANQSLTITGQGITAANAALAQSAAGVAGFNGNAAINNNDISGLGNFDFAAGGITLNLNSADATKAMTATNFKVANGAADGVITVNNNGATAGNLDILEFNDASVATTKTITVAAGSAIRFNSTPTAGNSLTLQAVANSTIGLTNDATLILKSKAAAAFSFAVANGTLGATGGDNNGVIVFDSSLAGAAANLTSNKAGNAVAVVGTNNTTRAQGFILKGMAANATTIDGQVYAKAIELQGGQLTFGQAVDVGANGTTNFTTAASQATISKTSNLGAVTFGAFAGNTLTVNSTADNTTLTGNFTGDATGLNGANFPTILFTGANTAKLAAADATQPVATNIKAIENNTAVAVTLGAGDYTTDLNLSNVGGSFILADGFELTGNVNATAGANALQAGTLVAQGNATISGDIGFNATAAKNPVPLGNITVADVANKVLTLGGANIIGSNAPGASINFGANVGGVVKLTNATPNGNIKVNYNLVLAADGKGTVDASTLTQGQTLTISGKIGAFDAAAPIKNATNSLAQLAIGEGNLVLSGGDVAINSLVMGDNSIVTLSHNTYKIVTTTDTPGNGTVIINPDQADPNNITTLAPGTQLGSNGSLLKAIKFQLVGVANGATDVTLNVGKDVNLYATNITTDTNNKGSFFFTGGGTNIVGGAIGTAGTGLFNNITVDADTTVTLQGASLFKGITTINKGGTLQLSGNYQTDSINTSGAGEGTLEFTNTNTISVNLQNTGAAANNSLAALKVSGGNVTILQAVNGNQLAMEVPQLITFNNKNLGASSILTLPVGMELDGINITSNAGSTNLRAVAVSGADSIIAATEVVGGNGNPVSIILNSNNDIEVQTPNFFGGIFTNKDKQGTATFNVANGAGQVNGLGGATQKLKTVTFSTNTINTGNTRVYDSIIEDGVTYTAGGIIDTSLQLGSTAGTGNVVFLNGADLLPTTTINALVPNKGNVTFQGSATVGDIAESGTSVALVEFTGASGSVAGLQGDIYSKTINFNGYNLTVLDEQVVLSGASSVNGQITLGTNELVFTGGASTWGPNTSLNTTLAGGDLGHIVINGGTITASGNVLTNVTINDQDSVNTPTTKYLLIGGGTNLTLPNGNSVSLDGTTFTSNQRFSDYSIIQDATSKDYFLQRTNIAGKVIAGDLASNTQYSNIPGLASNVGAILNPNNTGDAEKFLTNIGNLNSADTAQAIVALTAQDTNNLAVMQDIAAENISVLANRVHGVRYLHGPAGAPEGVLASPEGGVVGAADDAEDNVSYGGWAKAIYSDATQKSKGGVAGYSAKTTGGIFGFDTMANDNLMIGAAIGVTKTDMKYKNYRAGDKSTINGFSFSLYGAQQLVDNFFFQGATTFSTNQVKNKNKRYLANDSAQKVTETASASYDNLTYAVEGMFGYDAKVMENVLLTPMAGIRYIKSSDESYKETGTTFQNKSVTSKFSDKTDVIVGARVIGDSMNLSQFMFYPEAHAFVTHKVSGKLAKIQSSLDGQVTPFIGQPDKTDKTSYNLGLSVTTRPGPQMEYGIGYDANLASKYVAHTGTLKVRINF